MQLFDNLLWPFRASLLFYSISWQFTHYSRQVIVCHVSFQVSNGENFQIFVEDSVIFPLIHSLVKEKLLLQKITSLNVRKPCQMRSHFYPSAINHSSKRSSVGYGILVEIFFAYLQKVCASKEEKETLWQNLPAQVWLELEFLNFHGLRHIEDLSGSILQAVLPIQKF